MVEVSHYVPFSSAIRIMVSASPSLVGADQHRMSKKLHRAWPVRPAGWTYLSIEDTVSLAEGDSVWAVLSSFHTEIAPIAGLSDLVVAERTRK
jgi:hypothetical protein